MNAGPQAPTPKLSTSKHPDHARASAVALLEAKTLMYWITQVHWNGRDQITKKIACRPPTVQQAIADCNLIMQDLNPNRKLSQLAFALQGDIITRQRPKHNELGVPIATPLNK